MPKRSKAVLPAVSQTEALILAALSGGELYGLEIVEETARRGRRLSLGGLYTMLHRIEKKGLVVSRWGDADAERTGARRRYYALSGLGERVIEDYRRLLQPAPVNPALGGA